jgi:hypothetical protein
MAATPASARWCATVVEANREVSRPTTIFECCPLRTDTHGASQRLRNPGQATIDLPTFLDTAGHRRDEKRHSKEKIEERCAQVDGIHCKFRQRLVHKAIVLETRGYRLRLHVFLHIDRQVVDLALFDGCHQHVYPRPY